MHSRATRREAQWTWRRTRWIMRGQPSEFHLRGGDARMPKAVRYTPPARISVQTVCSIYFARFLNSTSHCRQTRPKTLQNVAFDFLAPFFAKLYSGTVFGETVAVGPFLIIWSMKINEEGFKSVRPYELFVSTWGIDGGRVF